MTLTPTGPACRAGPPSPIKPRWDGADVSPPLAWSGAPPGTQSFALIADDPDAPAGTWVHWVLYNLPGTVSGLPEKVAKVETLDLGAPARGVPISAARATAAPARRRDPPTAISSSCTRWTHR